MKVRTNDATGKLQELKFEDCDEKVKAKILAYLKQEGATKSSCGIAFNCNMVIHGYTGC